MSRSSDVIEELIRKALMGFQAGRAGPNSRDVNLAEVQVNVNEYMFML